MGNSEWVFRPSTHPADACHCALASLPRATVLRARGSKVRSATQSWRIDPPSPRPPARPIRCETVGRECVKAARTGQYLPNCGSGAAFMFTDETEHLSAATST